MFSYCLKHKSKVAAREVASISTSPELATPDGKKTSGVLDISCHG
jgi:hypothetical protein